MVKDGTFVVLQSFMINDLELKGNELTIYAIIYGFSQDGNQHFTGSLQYLADWTRSTKQGVAKALKSLVKKGYIQREDKYVNGVKFVEYWCTQLHGGIKQSCIGYATQLHGGIKQSCTNKIIDNINNNIDNKNIYIPEAEKPAEEIQKCVKHKYGEYKNVLLTDIDLEKLKTEFASDWQQRIEKLSIYKASTGKSYKNDLATIRNWARRDKEERQTVKKAVGEFVKGDLPF